MLQSLRRPISKGKEAARKPTTCVPFAVDDYRTLINDNDSETIHFSSDIIPAEYVVMPYYNIRRRLDASRDSYMFYQMPVAHCREKPIMSIESSNNNVFPRVEDYIDGVELEHNEENLNYNQLTIAFYSAFRWYYNEGQSISAFVEGMPLSFVRGISEPTLTEVSFYPF